MATNVSLNDTSFDDVVEVTTDGFEALRKLGNSTCEEKMLDDNMYMGAIFLTAMTLFTILMFTERRSTKSGGCKCRGRCGILLSVNFLENKTNRSMVVAAFILTTLDVLDILFQLDEIESFPFDKIFKMIIRIMAVFFLSFVYLPLFHCISVHTLWRQCLGLFFVLIVVPMSLLSSTTICHYAELDRYELYEQAAESIIVLLAGIFLTLKFIYRIVRMIRELRKTSPPVRSTKDPYQVQYIKNLLKKPIGNGILPTEAKLTHRIRKYLYKNIPGFRFSVTILVSVSLGILLYVTLISSSVGLMLDFYFVLWDIVQINRHALNDTIPNIVVEIAQLLASHKLGKGASHQTDNMSIADFLETQLNCLCASFVLAVSLAAFQVCSTVVYILKGYRKNVLSMYRQELDDNVMEGIDNVELVVNAIQFAGYQVAHMIWGYIVQLVVFFVLFLLFTEFIIFPVLFHYWGVVWALFVWLGPILFVKFLARYIQRLLVRKVFLVNRGRVFGIDNRKCFFNMMFFMFFYNIFSGLVSCVLRILKVTILCVWFFPRLDRSIFPHSFEKFDAGYKAYVCLLKLEERQNNVILLCFVQLLTDKCCKVQSEKTFDTLDQQKSLELIEVRSKAPRNRWFVAWTLMHNKSLKSERRGTKFDIITESTRV